jgi:glycosyltransferase involved in cell wall biosynthesis
MDEVILFRADRLMPRKMYASLLRAVAPVLAKRPKVRLICHMSTLDQGGDFRDLRSHFPPAVQERMNVTDFHDKYGGVQREVLALMYAAADLYVGTGAEGWGLCYAESLACGTPALGIRFSAVPEVIGPAGETVPVGALIDNIYGYFWARPDEQQYTLALDKLVSDIAHLRVLGMKGPYHVEQFTWARAAEQFSELISAAVRQEVAA